MDQRQHCIRSKRPDRVDIRLGRAGDHREGLRLPPPGQERLPGHARRRRSSARTSSATAGCGRACSSRARSCRPPSGRAAPSSRRSSRINGRPVRGVHRHHPLQRDDGRGPAPAAEARDPRRADGDARAGPGLPHRQGPARPDRRPAPLAARPSCSSRSPTPSRPTTPSAT